MHKNCHLLLSLSSTVFRFPPHAQMRSDQKKENTGNSGKKTEGSKCRGKGHGRVGGKRHKSATYFSDETYRQCDSSCAQLYQCKWDLEKVTYSVWTKGWLKWALRATTVLNLKNEQKIEMAVFISKVQELQCQLKQLDEEMSCSLVISKILKSLPLKYSHFHSAWYSTYKKEKLWIIWPKEKLWIIWAVDYSWKREGWKQLTARNKV